MKAMLQSSAMIRKGLRAISGLEVMKSWSSLILFNTMYSICKIKTEIIIKPVLDCMTLESGFGKST